MRPAIASDTLVKNDLETIRDDRVLNRAYPVFGGAPKVTLETVNGVLPEELRKRLEEMTAL